MFYRFRQWACRRHEHRLKRWLGTAGNYHRKGNAPSTSFFGAERVWEFFKDKHR
jgi:hypothetical protein